MAERVEFEGSVKYVQILDEKGKADEKLMPKLVDREIRQMYELMHLTRTFDNKALSLQRQGKIGTFAQVLGQEATQIGSALALGKEDWLFPMYRDMGSYIAMGMPMEMLFQYWAWDERGQKIPENINSFTMAIPVGTQMLHGAGAAWAMKLKKKKSAVMVDFGDGATSTGDFHEAMNFAGVYSLPVVFLCENNQYAISVPREKQTSSKTLAQKALGYGFDGIVVDGNDVFAVYKVAKEALDKARNGNGPTLIECFTYRIANHTTADDWTKYRSKEEVEKWKNKDPIDRLRKYMKEKGIWNESYEKSVEDKSQKLVEEAVKKFDAIEKPNIEDIFTFTYKEMTRQLHEQMGHLKEFIGEE